MMSSIKRFRLQKIFYFFFLDFFKSIALSSIMFKGPNGAGKGDKPRPTSISRKEYEERWDKIFKNKKESHGKTKKDKTDK